ncbi:hypothetical protein SEPCBS119000_003894 [Sporothrix epigloea]|uniref:Transcription factor n=1 Tax=Sporothrix epigloea TaxID=1892477 RepID=A0ABP0DS01_9PEZI
MDGSLRILDIQEREVGAVRAPSFPTPRPTNSGFPEPKKRARFASTFKQRMQATEDASAETKKQVSATPAPSLQPSTETSSQLPPSTKLDDKASIDRENRDMLNSLAPEEIAEARQQLLSNLDPALLQILLRRANLDDGSNAHLPGEGPDQKQKPEATMAAPEIRIEPAPKEPSNPKKTASFAPVEDGGERDVKSRSQRTSGEAITANDLQATPSSDGTISAPSPEATTPNHHHDGHDHVHDHDHDHASSSMHFPKAPTVPDLDPDDPDFLQNLHTKYFPNLPADPARLAWMAPLPTADSPADRESPYYPGQESLAVSQLRFDFRGRLIPPRRSREIPVTKGLHHHGVAPEAAGYTIGELARLARSAVPSQRCVAFQLLGRLLYRLGRGEFGGGASGLDEPTTDPRVQLAQGIWRSLSEGRVLETLREAAAVEEGQGHRGSRAYAIEAIWLYEKGGWKERWAGR